MPLSNLPRALRAALGGWNAARANRPPPTLLRRIARGGIVIVGLMILANIIIALVTEDPAPTATSQAKPATQPQQPQAWEAHVICQNFVRQQLHAPATAKFPARGRVEQHVGDQTFHILSHVDAQNLYGATIRNTYACTTQHTGNDHWRLIALQID